MVHTGHRLSKDIDAFIDDPQYLSFLSPRLVGERIWECETYAESGNHLRLVYPEGEIDFIVAAGITDLPPDRKTIDAEASQPGLPMATIDVEHPVEIALKKMTYRAGMLKIRDVFDIAVVDSKFSTLLLGNLHHVAHLMQPIQARLAAITDEFCRQELDELDIAEEWRPIAASCLRRVREIAARIPERQGNP